MPLVRSGAALAAVLAVAAIVATVAPLSAAPSLLGPWHETLPQPMSFGLASLDLRVGGRASCTYYYVSTAQRCTTWKLTRGAGGKNVLHLGLTDGTNASSVDLRYEFKGTQLWLEEDAPIQGEGATSGTWNSKLAR